LRLSVPLLLFSLLFSSASPAQDIRYVSGEKNISLRGGAGDDYPIVYRGIPPGTRLTVARTSDDGLWADINAENGITGWIPTQNLVVELPVQSNPSAVIPAVQETEEINAGMASGAPALTADSAELINRINTCDSEFNTIAQELHQLKQISGKTVQLDIDNRRLVEVTENLRSEAEMLQAENQRLQDRLESEDFMNGALAVLLGVIIALIAPRLVPQRRKSSGWA
jgi:SH3 domain protein